MQGIVTWDGSCARDDDGNWFAQLSNGWKPFFLGGGSCALSLRYEQCGELFANPVVSTDCPDPGVLQDGDRYVMACTSGRAEYPLRVSNDLVRWSAAGSVFSASNKPAWATGDFWAPELHRVDGKYLAYFSARHRDGDLAVGVASADDVLGPYRDSGAPLVRDPRGAIDAHAFEAPDGSRYLVWKTDGNASGVSTTIELQPLAADGLTLTGAARTLLSSTEPWEGGVIEGPWLIFESGYYYLFYSGNVYSSAAYGTGVARSKSLAEPFEKAPAAILRSNGTWAGPGHGSVMHAASGEWIFVFHAWPADRVGQSPPGREVLLTRIGWANGWPTMLGAPSSLSQPLP